MSDAFWIQVAGTIGVWITILLKSHVDNYRYRMQVLNSQRASQDREEIKKQLDENTVVTASQHPGVPAVKADLATIRAVSAAAFERLRERRSAGYEPGQPEGHEIGEETENRIRSGAGASDASACEGVSEPHDTSEGRSHR